MLSHNEHNPVIQDVGDAEDLQKLIYSAKQGDKKAFEVVFNKLFRPLYRYTFSKCHNKELAEDICQQSFLNFYKALPSYEPEKSPLAYLYTIAKRLLINEGERKKPLPFDEALLETVPDESVNTLGKAHIQLLATSINEYLPQLTPDEEDVVRLYFYGEFSHKEIADILEKEEAYIRKIKERALKKLRIFTQHLHDNT